MTAIFISHSSADNAAANDMKRRLEEQGHTSLFLDFDPETGLQAGSDWEQSLYQKLRECQAVIIILTPNWLASKWCFAEWTHARAQGKAIFPVKVQSCDPGGGFADTQQIDVTVDSKEGYERLWNGLKERGLDPADIFDRNPERPIYPGLMYFDEDDAAIFFGRGEEIGKTLETLDSLQRQGSEAPRFLLLLGASGSGKSSLARAGVLPRLRKRPAEWLPLRPFRPQKNPIEELAVALSMGFEKLGRPRDWKAISTELQEAAESPAGAQRLVRLVRDLALAAQQPEATVLITIDQAEELFGYSDGEAAARFLRLLRAGLETGDRRLMAIATMRSDFLDQFQNHPVLQDSEYPHHFRYRNLPVEAMPQKGFPEVIRGPARLAGLQLDDGLVDAMVNDTGTRDALPLLAFTLRRLYDRFRDDGRLTLEEYESLGRLEGAIREAAEQIITDAKPSKEELAALQGAFVPGMVGFNGTEFTRRRAYFNELPLPAHPLLDRFIEARLLSKQDSGGGKTIEVAHEALLRTWPLLKEWLEAGRDNLRLQASLETATREWQERGQSDEDLRHGAWLDEAEKLLATPGYQTTADSNERAYLKACRTAQKAWEAREKEVREQEILNLQKTAAAQKKAAEAAEVARVAGEKARDQAIKFAKSSRKKTRIAAGIAFVAVIFLLVAMGFGYQAYDKKKAAQRALVDADFLQAAEKIGQQRVDEALAHLARAVRTSSDDRAAADRIFSLLADRRFLLPASAPHELPGRITDIHSTPDNRVLVAVINGSTAQVFNARTGGAVTKPIEHDGLPVQMAQISPDGKWLATACGGSDTGSATDVWPYRRPYSNEQEKSSDSDKPQTNYRYGRVWDIATGEPKTPPLKHEKAVVDISFNNTSTRVATASDDQSALVWEVATGQAVTPPLKHDASVTNVRFSPDGTRLAVVSDGLKVWDIKSSQTIWQTSQDSGKEEDSTVVEASYSPDGLYIAAVFEVSNYDENTQRLALLNANTGKQFGTGYEASFITSYQIGQNNNVLVSHAGRYRNKSYGGGVDELSGYSGDGDNNISNATGNKPVAAVAFAPDTSEVFIAYFDNTILWTERYSFDDLSTIGSIKLPEPPEHVETSASGKELIVLFGAKGNTVQLWSLETYIQNSEIHSISPPPNLQSLLEPSQESETIADTSPDGRRLLKYISDTSLIVADAKTKAQLSGPITAVGGYDGGGISTAKFSPNGKLIAVGEGGDFRLGKGFARIWDAATGHPLTDPLPHQRAVSSIVFSPDYDRLVTLANLTPADSPLLEQVWDMRRGKPLTDALQTNTNIDVGRAELSHDQSQLTVTKSDSEETEGFTEVRDVAFPKDKTLPQWLPLLAEIAGGLRINTETGVLEPLPDRWQKLETLRAELASSDLDDPATRFGKWFLSNPQTRTISPYSKFSLSDYVAYCINDGSGTLLDYAEKLSVGNNKLLEKIKARRERH